MSEKTPSEKKNKTEVLVSNQNSSDKKTKVVQVSSSFSGPLPPPEVLERYELIAPGSARKIIKMAEDQSNHRRKMEEVVILGNSRRSDRGQWMAFSLAILLSSFATFAVVYGGYETFGSVLAGGLILGIVKVFVTGINRSDREIESKSSQDRDLQNRLMPEIKSNGSTDSTSEDNSVRSLSS